MAVKVEVGFIVGGFVDDGNDVQPHAEPQLLDADPEAPKRVD